MTKELYYDSAYISEFFAEVISCEKKDGKGGKDCYEVILDRTAFFPEQGGQGSDRGVLEFGDAGNAAKVMHVSIGSEIRHLVDREIPVGTTVHGVIDWAHRFSNMQQHTGEHIFSGLVNSDFGYNNVGFHLSDSEVTMDYDGVLSAEDVKTLELKANQAIWANLEVLCEFPAADKLAEIPYRSKKELEGDVRIVTIPGIDICACCAPHVIRTGEIGLLKVVGLQNYKGGVRVNILCGQRALEYLQSEHEIVSELSGMLTTSSDKVIASVKRAFEDNSAMKAELSQAKEALIEYELEDIVKAASTDREKGIFVSSDNSDIYVIKDNSYDSNMMRKLVNELASKKAGYCGVFAGSADKGYRFIVASGTAGKDCKALCDKLRSDFGAKGGGAPAMVQGSMNHSDIETVIASISE
jgi:alanyl-tRNA synthetase